jgi:hypothetical protein
VYFEASTSQYSLDAVSACTPGAIEAALILLAGRPPSEATAEAAVRAAHGYKERTHVYADDVISGVPRYACALSLAETYQTSYAVGDPSRRKEFFGVTKSESVFLQDLPQVAERLWEWKSEKGEARVVALLTKAPETVLAALTDDELRPWVLFDTHKRAQHAGAVRDRVTAWRITAYLTACE